MFLRIAFLLAAAPLFAADPPAGLQGAWRLVGIEASGRLNEMKDRQPRCVIKGDLFKYGPEDVAKISVDSKADPKGIDMKFVGFNSTHEGIYRLEKDELKICINANAEGVKERPRAFDTKDQESWRLLVFRREKESEAATDGLSGYVGMMLAFNDETKSVVINGLIDGSPAKKSDLKTNDVLLEVGRVAVTDLMSVLEAVRSVKPGDKLVLKVRRGDKEMETTIKVATLPLQLILGLT
jgi:uncharacterized protein (TIGR03067 family)